MATDQQIAQMPIQEVVHQPGGNGLASPPFQVPLNILGIFGWHNIENGVEACVCDGILIPGTKAKTEFIRLIGRRSFVRRVLLKPGPLEVVASGLTQDHLKLTLTMSFKYEVKDPVYVSSLENPLAELRNLIEGLAVECIHSRSFAEFIGDEGEVRVLLKTRLQGEETILDKYIIHEVLKATPSGDESLVEITRKTRAAAEQRYLVEEEGKNREVEARYTVAIERERVQLDEEIAQRKHEREKEIRELEARSEIIKAAITTLGEVASSGIDPTKLTKEVISTIVEQVPSVQLTSGSRTALPDAQQTISQDNVRNQLEIEKNALASIKNNLGIITYDVLESQSKVKGAIIQIGGCEIIFKCGDNYPQEQPEAIVRFSDGRIQTMEGYWISGVSNSLAQALLVIIHQIDTGDQ